MIVLKFQTRFFALEEQEDGVIQTVQDIQNCIRELLIDASAVNTRLYLDDLQITMTRGDDGHEGPLPLQVHLTANQEKYPEQEKLSRKGCGCSH